MRHLGKEGTGDELPLLEELPRVGDESLRLLVDGALISLQLSSAHEAVGHLHELALLMQHSDEHVSVHSQRSTTPVFEGEVEPLTIIVCPDVFLVHGPVCGPPETLDPRALHIIEQFVD